MPLFPSGNLKHALSGAEPTGVHLISDIQLEGVAIRGDASVRRPAQLIIPFTKDAPATTDIHFYLVDITNPKEEDVWVSVEFSITRECTGRDDGY